MRALWTFLVVVLGAGSAQATILYGISGDDVGVPRRVQQIDTVAMTVNPVIDLGDGSTGYFGLAFRPADSRFYTVAQDNQGVSTLHSFSLGSGTTNPLLALGTGFVGGLAYDPTGDRFFGLANGLGGASSLFEIDTGAMTTTLLDGALGFGLAGGLTFNGDDGMLYALGSDFGFTQTLFSIDPSVAGSSAAASNALGMGIIGGVDYDSVTGSYFAVGNETGSSELLDVALGGDDTSLFGLSPFPSFTFSALTNLNGGVAVVPEPTTAVLLGLGLVALGTRRRAV